MGEGIGTLPEVSLVQCIFGDAGRIILSVRTADFITVGVEVSYGTVSRECSCCTRVTTLDKIVKDEGTLWTKTDKRNPKKLYWDLPVGGVRVRKERKTYWLRQDKESPSYTHRRQSSSGHVVPQRLVWLHVHLFLAGGSNTVSCTLHSPPFAYIHFSFQSGRRKCSQSVCRGPCAPFPHQLVTRYDRYLPSCFYKSSQ
jgi:hypothetical protein